MASTFEAAAAALRDLQTVYGKGVEQAFSITNQIAAIDMSSPTALEQLKALNEQYKSIAAEFNPQITQASSLAASMANDLPPDGLFSSKKKDAIAQYSQTQTQLIGLSTTLKSARDDMRAKIAQLEAEAASKTATVEPTETATDTATTVTTEEATPEGTVAATATTESGSGVDPLSSDDADVAALAAAPQTPNPVGQKAATTSPLSQSPDADPYKTIAKPNPLSTLSSYTYSLVLYMVTPEVMNSFISAGGKMKGISLKGPGVYVVAQSGGINNSIERRIENNTKELREENGGLGLDYYLDDLNLQTLLPGGKNKNTVATTLAFKIIEPTSFTFLQDLAKAATKLNEESVLLGKKATSPSNGFKQPYIFGIKFHGYNADGSVVTKDDAQFKDYDNGYGDNNSVIERYFSIMFENIKFKLDGRTVTYDCSALVLSEQAAYGKINATIKGSPSIEGATVGEVLGNAGGKGSRGLMKVLSDETLDQQTKNQVSKPNTYSIEFLDAEGKPDPTGKIASANIVTDETFLAEVSPMAKVGTTDGVTIAKQFGATSASANRKSISLAQGQNVINVIDNVIVKSEYVSAALKQAMTQGIESKAKNAADIKELEWYSVNPLVKIKGIDSTTNDWSYDIVYQIRPYAIPYIPSVYVSKTTKYPGPYKFYNYWLSGENSEVISYVQDYDNLYFSVAAMPTSGSIANNSSNKSVAPFPQGQDKTASGQNNGSVINENVRAQLYGVDQCQVKIKILGDPDYIMSTVGTNQSGISKFYGGDRSINPFGGQVFIQIAFSTASDYKSDGLMDVSDQLQFYKTDKVRKAGIKGIVYMVNIIESSFSKGTFTQTLDCLMVDESRLILKDTPVEKTDAAKSDGNASSNTTPSPTSNNNLDASGRTTAASDPIVVTNSNATSAPATSTTDDSPPASTSTELPSTTTTAPPPVVTTPALFVAPNPTPTASTTFAGAMIKAYSNSVGMNLFVPVFLPSGKELPNVRGWGAEQWDAQIAIADPRDLEALTSLKANYDTVIQPLINDVNEKVAANEKARAEYNQALTSPSTAGTSAAT